MARSFWKQEHGSASAQLFDDCFERTTVAKRVMRNSPIRGAAERYDVSYLHQARAGEAVTQCGLRGDAHFARNDVKCQHCIDERVLVIHRHQNRTVQRDTVQSSDAYVAVEPVQADSAEPACQSLNHSSRLWRAGRRLCSWKVVRDATHDK